MTTDDKLAVSQEAREAAADYYDARFPKERTLAPMMRAGRADGSMTVQTFARFEAQARLAGERAACSHRRSTKGQSIGRSRSPLSSTGRGEVRRYLAWRRKLSPAPLFLLAFVEAAFLLVAWALAAAVVFAVIAAPFVVSPWFLALYFCLVMACQALADRKERIAGSNRKAHHAD